MASIFHATFVEAERDRNARFGSRDRITLQTPQQPSVKSSGRELINFSSNDYLGLANHHALIDAASSAAIEWGAGSGAADLLSGHLGPHAELEKDLAAFVGAERALLFSCGYMANLAIGTALVGKQDIALHDKLNHASLIDGARLGAAKFKRFAHANVGHATAILQSYAFRRCMIVTDGVFSMDGDIADLVTLKKLADSYDGLLVVDDAHGFGVVGCSGTGSLSSAGLTPTGNVLYMGTLGKALGSYGAFIAGDGILIEQLMQTARSYIYTTALPPAIAATSIAALRVLKQSGSGLRQNLQQRIQQFKLAMQTSRFNLQTSETAIQPIIIGSDSEAVALSAELERRGFLVRAIRPPTVPSGAARLRVTLSASHSIEQVDRLVSALIDIS